MKPSTPDSQPSASGGRFVGRTKTRLRIDRHEVSPQKNTRKAENGKLENWKIEMSQG
jgi:hypothetical protein